MGDQFVEKDDCDGACFDRSVLPAIFGGRSGWGPMRVAWDTNILIDYTEHLLLYREDDDAPYEPAAGLPTDYAEELVALDAFMQIWMIRDVRIYVSGVQFDDGPLSEHRRDVRAEQLQQIAAALECLELEPPGRLLDETEAPAYDLPRGLTKNDRHIVSEALRFRCDVLLTRDDDDILKRREALMALGLAALRPTEWLDAMAQGDQFGVQGCAHGLIFPDSHKWLHLDAARVAATTDK